MHMPGPVALSFESYILLSLFVFSSVTFLNSVCEGCLQRLVESIIFPRSGVRCGYEPPNMVPAKELKSSPGVVGALNS